MREKRDAASFQEMERLECISACIAVRLRKGQPVGWSNGIGVILARPIVRPAADIAHFQLRILKDFTLHGSVELQDIRSPVTEVLTNAGNSQAGAKAANHVPICVRIVHASGKLVCIVEE